MTDDALVQAAARAYIYGYPLLYNLDEIDKVVTGRGTMSITRSRGTPSPPFDRSSTTPPSSSARTTTPCTSSLPSTCRAVRCCSRCPTPPTGTTCCSSSTRGPTTSPTSADEVPARRQGRSRSCRRASSARSTTTRPSCTRRRPIVIIIGRIQVDGVADLPSVHAATGPVHAAPAPTRRRRWPASPHRADGVADASSGGSGSASRSAAFPPPAGDAPFVEALEHVRTDRADSPFVDPDPLAGRRVAGGPAGRRRHDRATGRRRAPVEWLDLSAKHYFDYNLDSFEVGTIDAPEWKIEDRRRPRSPARWLREPGCGVTTATRPATT